MSKHIDDGMSTPSPHHREMMGTLPKIPLAPSTPSARRQGWFQRPTFKELVAGASVLITAISGAGFVGLRAAERENPTAQSVERLQSELESGETLKNLKALTSALEEAKVERVLERNRREATQIVRSEQIRLLLEGFGKLNGGPPNPSWERKLQHRWEPLPPDGIRVPMHLTSAQFPDLETALKSIN